MLQAQQSLYELIGINSELNRRVFRSGLWVLASGIRVRAGERLWARNFEPMRNNLIFNPSTIVARVQGCAIRR